MRRLLYSPKAYAFVRTDDHPEGVDISEYLVRGNVHRRTGAASTAELTLRNPNKVFTKPGAPFFRPMDPVTIFLTRLENRPIQVYTGYLDSTPYLQLFPGTVTLRSTCTLKRLLHTYWDPSLPYVFDGFLREFGWNIDTQTGRMFHDDLYDGPTLDQAKGNLTDGSMGALLFATMRHVGRWDPDTIYIEKLPEGIAPKMADMFNRLGQDNKAIQDNVQYLVKTIVGAGSAGTGGGPMGEAPDLGKDGTYTIGELVRLALALGLEGEAAITAAAISMAESAGDARVVNSIGCVGLWQVNSGVHKVYTIEELKDPEKNGKEMIRISGGGKNWRPWTVYTGADTPGNEKTYLRHMDAARRAHALVGGVPSLEDWNQSVGGRNDRDQDSSGRREAGTAPAPVRGKKGGGSWVYGAGIPKTLNSDMQSFMSRMASFYDGTITVTTTTNHGYLTANGNVSDHNDGGAADLGGAVNWGGELDGEGGYKLAVAAYRACGLSYDAAVAKSNVPSYERVPCPEGAVQILWRVEGHHDHVHIGTGPVGAHGPGTGAPRARQVFLEGDSIAVGAKPHLKKRNSGLQSSAAIGRTSTQGEADVRANRGKIKDALVVALGSNDGNVATFTNNVETIMDLVGTDVQVYWVNIAGGVADGVPDTDFNDALDAEAAKRDNLTIIDWKAEVVAGRAKLGADGTHPTASGYKLLGNLIADAVGDGDNAGAAAASLPGGEASGSAAAFAGYMNLPGTLDVAEAIGLSGQKSLLNDQPLFPFVEQIASASLRDFQSMPNGNFFAFFPDYFGGFGHRTPYWLIDDIEVLDGGIDLTDDFLVTNTFVVGDINLDFQINFADRLLSGGVMDVASAFKSGFIGKGGLSPTGVTDFLQKYGVRPYKEENPMIRSPYYEAFLAYQKFMELWAKQFATRFQFTFMPELYPGGIVGLQDHGIQCYIDEVIHNFDYEDGFTTDAILSAPAAMATSSTGVSAGMVRGFDFDVSEESKQGDH